MLARELRGMTQGELAEQSGSTQGFVSQVESRLKIASEEKADKFAEVLRLPRTFFYQSERYSGFGTSFIFHRKKSSARTGHLRRLQAEVNLFRIHMNRLLQSVPVHTEVEFSSLDIDDHDGNAELIASFVRANWKLPLGPIVNLIQVVESAGGLVFKFSFGGMDVDAISQWPDGMPPLFFLNADAPADRLRYSLAHEIGHVVMHRVVNPDLEAEADRFASELLMPAKEIAGQLMDITLKSAARLKPYWRVSMQALIRRARDLAAIPDSQYTRLFRQLSVAGMRKNEPADIAGERPSLVDRIISEFRQQNGYSNADVAAVLHLREQEFCDRYLPPEPPRGLRLVSA